MINIITTTQVQMDEYFNEETMATFTVYIGEGEDKPADIWESSFKVTDNQIETDRAAAIALQELSAKLLALTAEPGPVAA